MIGAAIGGTSEVHQFRPLEDARWSPFLQRHSKASAFHSAAWLDSLRRTYGYQPVAFTTTPAGKELRNAVVFCRVQSWLTGTRLVSLPFSDHCEPLVDNPADLERIFSVLEDEFRKQKLRYIELRPLYTPDGTTGAFRSNHTFRFHQLDLSPEIDVLFKNCHKSSIHGKLSRAEREQVTQKSGQSEDLLDAFHRLLLSTRRRHHIPPQPKRWFRNLIECFGNDLQIRVAYKGGVPVASILTIRFKDTLVYKYGCSDVLYNNLGGMVLLIWTAIQEAKQQGLRVLDLGRSDLDHSGLISFKERWGGVGSELSYLRFDGSPSSKSQFAAPGSDWKGRFAKGIFSRLPDRLLYSVGDLIYRHIG